MSDYLTIGSDAAVAQAQKSFSEGGIPIGACLMIENAVIAVGHNMRVQRSSNVLHGETACIENAGHSFDLSRATMFSTLAPCLMCSGAILLFGIPRTIILDNENVSDFETGIDRLRAGGVEVILRRDARAVEMNYKFQNEPETRSIWMGDVGTSS